MRHIGALGMAVLLLGGCTPAGTASPSIPSTAWSPSASVVPSATPTPVGSASASVAARPSGEPTLSLGPDVIAEVVTSDLVMRTAPAIVPESIVYPGRLGPGDRLYLVKGPVLADGYDWYLAAPYAARVNEEGDPSSTVWVRFGWVAAADKTGEPWIMPIEPACPTEATVDRLHGLHAVLRLACFSDGTVNLEGIVTCHDLGHPIPLSTPDWLTWDACYINPSDAGPYDPFKAGSGLGIPIHYPPDAERVTGSLAITGHFDDPRATQCLTFIPIEESDVYGQELQHQATQLGCRASLVVDSAAPTSEGP
jgi:hypothetical protein